jgi:ubiquinone/menaquinone biosynthesis C-methylase UbiE
VSQVEHFDRLAARYDELRGRPPESPLDRLLAAEGELAGKRVLDVGCGTGGLLLTLRDRYGCRVAGVDPSSGMLAAAREKLGPSADLRAARAEQLPFPDGSFDGAIATLVAHHLDRARAFPEIRRVLVSGGRFLVATSNPDAFPRFWLAPLFPSYVEIERRRFPSRQTLGADLRGAGFSAVRVVPLALRRRFSRAEALEKLRGRYASTFDHLDEQEYRDGLGRAERELPDPVDYVFELMVVVGTA